MPQPTTNNQEPGTNNQQPVTSNQQPETKNQEPVTNQPNRSADQPIFCLTFLLVFAIIALVERLSWSKYVILVKPLL